MTIQPTWLTSISTFEQFCQDARDRPEQVYLSGERPCQPAALTLASLAEERAVFWIRGPDWKARGVRKCAGERAIDRIERESQRRGKPKRVALRNIRFLRES